MEIALFILGLLGVMLLANAGWIPVSLGLAKEPPPKPIDDKIGVSFYGQVFSEAEVEWLTRRDED